MCRPNSQEDSNLMPLKPRSRSHRFLHLESYFLL
uniref:Uncharacterized protein n=1 Tax=Myoviridae sp. ctNQV2 TaxID=2827683 RepID=A0A8S5RZN4_9CAUD|nr:MAG TPA: hypothetical protein [Myoviridae sp. ctNQV2]